MIFALVPAIGLKGRLHSPRARGSLFLLMAVSVILMLALENLTMGLDDLPHPPRMGVFIANAFYFILHPLPALSFILYADYLIRSRRKVFGPVAIWILGYALVNVLLVSANLVIHAWLRSDTGLFEFFTAGEGTGYIRGAWFSPYMVFLCLPLVYAIFFLLRHVSRMDRRERFPLLFFPVPAIAGSVLQLAWQGMNYIWPGACISLLILYVQMRMRELNEDYLTTAFNRRYLDWYLESRINSWSPSRGFAGLMIDMDDFKGINDRLGHAAGDRALVVAVEVVRRALRHMDVIARFAGDEFVVVLEMGDRTDYQSVIARIYREIGKENREGSCACPLSLSIGGAVYSPVHHRDAQAFLRAMDQDMYREKLYRKALVPALGE
jgi:diguanylate cyclase (GGDEF)-like protein